MAKPHLGLSLMPEANFLQAALPLFQEGLVQAVEWSFDTIAHAKHEPIWLAPLLTEFASEKRLIGHGVYYSLFDAKWNQKQEKWLKKLAIEVQRFPYHHISEHFGFMSNADYHKGFPLPVPLNETTLSIGVDRLLRLQDVAQVPVGIENLALAFNEKDVRQQGEFIARLIEPVNGFIILDLHNIYCQSENFGIPLWDLIRLYPLDRVKEIHLSGGSWQASTYAQKPIRRDTHDESIPLPILEILPKVLDACKYCEFVIIERLGDTFLTELDFINYRADFMQVRQILAETSSVFETKNWGNTAKAPKQALEDLTLFSEQRELSAALLSNKTPEELQRDLQSKNWNLKQWEISLIETAMLLSKKWDS